MAEPQVAPTAKADEPVQRAVFRELGRSGLRREGGTIWEEPLTELQGDRGRNVYREMSLNDATVGRILYAIEQVVLSVEWRVEPGEGPDGEAAAEFLEECMGDMSHSWEDFLSEVLTMLVYGWAYFETVYKHRRGPHPNKPEQNSKYDDDKIGWRKFALRAQSTLDEWMFDDAGGIQGMKQQDPNTGEVVEIPIQRSLLFRTKPAGGNPEGESMLRRGYRSWFFKKRTEEIEGIGIERDLAGLPVVQPPQGVNLFTSTDPAMVAQYARCQQLVTSIRMDDQAGVILPFGWEFRLERGGGPRSIDTNAVLQRYDWNIAGSVLAQFLELGKGETGSWALGTSHKDLFAQSVRALCRQRIAATINRFAVGPLMRINGFRLDKDPVITPSDPARPMLDDVSEPLKALADAGILTPDSTLEEFVRDLGGLPPPEEEEPEEPGAGGKPPPKTPEIAPDEELSLKLRLQKDMCLRLLWQPLGEVRRSPALIHDVRRHVRRALPKNAKSADAWPPNDHVIWEEAFGILLARDDMSEATSRLGDMPRNEFAGLVKHAWRLGPTQEAEDASEEMQPKMAGDFLRDGLDEGSHDHAS